MKVAMARTSVSWTATVLETVRRPFFTRTDSITASMDQVTANMAELSGHVSAMTGVARALSAAIGAPVTGISAVAYGVRRAVALRRPEAAGHRLKYKEPLG